MESTNELAFEVRKTDTGVGLFAKQDMKRWHMVFMERPLVSFEGMREKRAMVLDPAKAFGNIKSSRNQGDRNQC